MKTGRISTVILALSVVCIMATGCGSSMDMNGRNYSSSQSANNNAVAQDFADEEKSEDEQDFNTEEYDVIEETGFKSPLSEPFSTFSADVDTASYANIRRMINDNREVNKDAVRIEEMLNYFSYDYPAPEGNEPFSITPEISDCPWNDNTKLMMIGLQAEKLDKSALPQSNIVFLIDVSGSMDMPDKLPLVKSAFRLLSENLSSSDRISIVTYAGSDKTVLSGATGNEQLEIESALNSLFAGGGTAGADGIETAYELAEKYFIEGGNNRVILATDGDLNIGLSSEGDLKRLITQKRKSGIFLSVLGFGSGNLKNNKLETLADNGNGNYNYIDSIAEARKVLVSEMGGTLFTVAKDVKLQVEFNPATVKGYRLIGYENRRLATEDFNDDSKDAGEIGMGHSVTALYEIALDGSEQEVPQPTTKYQSAESNNSFDLATLSVRYKEPDSDNSNLLERVLTADDISGSPSDNLKFAECVTEFGMLLRDSDYKGTSSTENILAMLDEIPEFIDDEYKTEFAELVATWQKNNPAKKKNILIKVEQS